MKSKDYWRQRELRALLRSKSRDEAFVKGEIAEVYNRLLSNINREIRSQVINFSVDGKISYEKARKLIEKSDVSEYEDLAKRYVDEKNFSDEANRILKLYNVSMRVNRLEFIGGLIRLHALEAGSRIEDSLRDHLIEGSIGEYRRQAGIVGSFVSDDAIRRRAEYIVGQDYMDAHFSDRVWKHTKELQRRVERNVEAVLMQGRSSKDFARKLSDLVSNDIKNARYASERLAYTESGRVWIQTQLDSYRKFGYEALEVLTEPTACSSCAPHDGDIVKLKDVVEGDNIPLWHPFCRCTTVAYFEENKSNREDSGYNINEIPDELKDFNLDMDVGKQKNHIYGTNEFKQRTKNGVPPSYFNNSLEDVEKAFNKIKYTGILKPDNEENIVIETTLCDILESRVLNDIENKLYNTDVVTIRYNKKKGWHMYPDYPSKAKELRK
ncbi:MAG: minor capsid protein [Anaerococcus sp.]|nr:minor capsid protein [Anaerococcus sp.]